MAEQHSNVSSDLIWEICRANNAYLVKRTSGGGVQFSRDPLNLVNKHSRKYAGFVNDKAVGIHPAEKGGVTMVTKKTKHHNRPAANKNEVSWTGNKSGPKIYKGIVNYTAKQGYRADLRQEAVARASAIRRSSQPKKEVPEKKLRGSKAKKAAEKDSS
ncbi:60s ribosomal protein l28 [Lasallia pustulata]|uniref:60s ribosomal protein l28 n=1 Tax=Lasallia pustulata TaxID=136370 RepID=A0A1W5CY45_9LECA|nr:60s ribosomal protein l28 [Lasallia pustulata]